MPALQFQVNFTRSRTVQRGIVAQAQQPSHPVVDRRSMATLLLASLPLASLLVGAAAEASPASGGTPGFGKSAKARVSETNARRARLAETANRLREKAKAEAK